MSSRFKLKILLLFAQRPAQTISRRPEWLSKPSNPQRKDPNDAVRISGGEKRCGVSQKVTAYPRGSKARARCGSARTLRGCEVQQRPSRILVRQHRIHGYRTVFVRSRACQPHRITTLVTRPRGPIGPRSAAAPPRRPRRGSPSTARRPRILDQSVGMGLASRNVPRTKDFISESRQVMPADRTEPLARITEWMNAIPHAATRSSPGSASSAAISVA